MTRQTPADYLQGLLDMGYSEAEAIQMANNVYNSPRAEKTGVKDAARNWAEGKAKDYAKDQVSQIGKQALTSSVGDAASAEAAANAAGALDYTSGVGQAAEELMKGPTLASAARTPLEDTPWSAGPLGTAAGAYGLYDIGNRWGSGDRSIKGAGLNTLEGAASGAAIGSNFGPVGTLAGGIGGGLYGLAGSFIKTGKNKDQIQRDSIRKMLQQGGLVDENYGLKIGGGSTFDIGREGGKQSFDVDFEDPRAGMSVGWAAPLAQILSHGDHKARTDIAGWLTNAALSNTSDLEGSRKNILAVLKGMNLSSDDAVQMLHQQKDAGLLSQDELNAEVYALGTLNSGNYGKIEVPKMSFMPGQEQAFQPTDSKAQPLNTSPSILGEIPKTLSPDNLYPFLRSSTSSPGIDKSGKRISY